MSPILFYFIIKTIILSGNVNLSAILIINF